MLNGAHFEQLGPPRIVRIEGCVRCGAAETLPRDLEIAPIDEVTFRYQFCLVCVQEFVSLPPAQSEEFQDEITKRIEQATKGLLARAQCGLRCGDWTA